MGRRRYAVTALFLTMALVAGACTDDDDDDDAGGTGETSAQTSPVRVTLSATSLEVPAQVAGGVVTVEFQSQVPEGEVDFTRVAPGTDDQAFKEGIAALVGGGPVPDFFQASSGIGGGSQPGVTTHSIQVEAGSYIAWAIPQTGDGDGDEGETRRPPPEAVVTKAFTVSGGSAGALPTTDGTITGRDYTFDVDVRAGDTFTFRNEGPDQLHHAELLNFGTLAPATVEAYLVEFLMSEEDAPPPPGFAGVDFETIEAGGSGVFTPGLGGTFQAQLRSGNTYAVVCFIHDRTGGPPHVFANNMRTVFTVA